MRFFKALIDGLLNGLATIFSVVRFLLLLLLISFSFYFVFLTWCLRLHARVLRRPFCVDSGNSMCFSYWKNVRLKLYVVASQIEHLLFQLLLKECTIEAHRSSAHAVNARTFQLLLKECTIEAPKCVANRKRTCVSVVIERMYDWSRTPTLNHGRSKKFQLLLKECTIEADVFGPIICYFRFQLLLKECTIEANVSQHKDCERGVSVVIERMYDWSSETNWFGFFWN